MTSTLLALLLLSQVDGPTTPPAGARYLTRLEVTTLALLPRAGVGAEEGFAQVEPTLILDGGAELGQGGTLLFPQGQGTLRPGAFACVGLGVDHAR